jgi:hypothetical protein
MNSWLLKIGYSEIVPRQILHFWVQPFHFGSGNFPLTPCWLWGLILRAPDVSVWTISCMERTSSFKMRLRSWECLCNRSMDQNAAM